MKHDFSQVFDTENPLWGDVLEIFEKNERFERKKTPGRALHHKFPRSFSKLLNEDIDNDFDNLISLSLADHFMIHYYYYKLAKEQFKARMALAFSYMMNCKFEKLCQISPDIALTLSKEYEKTENELLKETGKARIGSKRSEETIKNMKAAWVRRKENGPEKPHTEEEKQKISNSLKGIKRSPETRAKMSTAKKGLIKTEEHLQHIREAKARNGLNEETRYRMGSGMRGKHPIFSEEHKKHISEAKFGTKYTEESKLKMSLAKKGKKTGPLSEEHKEKIRQAKLGKKRGPISKEQKAKVSEKLKGRHWHLENGKRVWD